MYCFVILLLFNEIQMSVRRFSAIPHLRDHLFLCSPPTTYLLRLVLALFISLNIVSFTLDRRRLASDIKQAPTFI